MAIRKEGIPVVLPLEIEGRLGPSTDSDLLPLDINGRVFLLESSEVQGWIGFLFEKEKVPPRTFFVPPEAVIGPIFVEVERGISRYDGRPNDLTISEFMDASLPLLRAQKICRFFLGREDLDLGGKAKFGGVLEDIDGKAEMAVWFIRAEVRKTGREILEGIGWTQRRSFAVWFPFMELAECLERVPNDTRVPLKELQGVQSALSTVGTQLSNFLSKLSPIRREDLEVLSGQINSFTRRSFF